MLNRDFSESRNVIRPAVEGRDVSEGATTGLVEELAAGDVNLLQCLEAISGETWAHDIEPVEVLATPLAQESGGIWPNPGLAAESRLEGRDDTFWIDVEMAGEGGGGAAALFRVGIAGL
jgi:hypothetical protein